MFPTVTVASLPASSVVTVAVAPVIDADVPSLPSSPFSPLGIPNVKSKPLLNSPPVKETSAVAFSPAPSVVVVADAPVIDADFPSLPLEPGSPLSPSLIVIVFSRGLLSPA